MAQNIDKEVQGNQHNYWRQKAQGPAKLNHPMMKNKHAGQNENNAS